jgi:DNA-binding transcriptional MerR regulator
MKANQTQPNPAEFRPKPLTVEQENVIDLLITGKSERETAEVCGVNRSTIAQWRQIPLFVATMNQRRQALWQESHEKLRSLILGAMGTLEGRITSLTNRELLQLIAMTADLSKPEGETDPSDVALLMLAKRMSAEGIPRSGMDDLLIDLDKNPRYEQRQREILRELAGEDT